MTIAELIVQTDNQALLLRKLVDSHIDCVKNFPLDYDPVSIAKLEHCYNSLLTLNDLLAKPITEDIS